MCPVYFYEETASPFLQNCATFTQAFESRGYESNFLPKMNSFFIMIKHSWPLPNKQLAANQTIYEVHFLLHVMN